MPRDATSALGGGGVLEQLDTTGLAVAKRVEALLSRPEPVEPFLGHICRICMTSGVATPATASAEPRCKKARRDALMLFGLFEFMMFSLLSLFFQIQKLID